MRTVLTLVWYSFASVLIAAIVISSWRAGDAEAALMALIFGPALLVVR